MSGTYIIRVCCMRGAAHLRGIPGAKQQPPCKKKRSCSQCNFRILSLASFGNSQRALPIPCNLGRVCTPRRPSASHRKIETWCRDLPPNLKNNEKVCMHICCGGSLTPHMPALLRMNGCGSAIEQYCCKSLGVSGMSTPTPHSPSYICITNAPHRKLQTNTGKDAPTPTSYLRSRQHPFPKTLSVPCTTVISAVANLDTRVHRTER